MLGNPRDHGVFLPYAQSDRYSWHLVEVILELFGRGKGGTFVDIGANIGLMTLPIAAQGINCEAFEADPDVFMLLADNIALSGFADRCG